MTEYVVIEYPDGAQYAVLADRVHNHPGAKIIGAEHPTGTTQRLPAEAVPESKPAKAAPAS